MAKTCACGCGASLPNRPYKDALGNEYATAYCILEKNNACDICGGYTGSDFDKEKHDYKCNGHYSIYE